MLRMFQIALRRIAESQLHGVVQYLLTRHLRYLRAKIAILAWRRAARPGNIADIRRRSTITIALSNGKRTFISKRQLGHHVRCNSPYNVIIGLLRGHHWYKTSGRHRRVSHDKRFRYRCPIRQDHYCHDFN